MMQAIRAKYRIEERHEKRKAERELKKVQPFIDELELEAEIAIFYTPERFTYSEIYELYLSKWADLMERFKNFNLIYIEVDPMYFVHKYKPLPSVKAWKKQHI